jgi:hypothetical protein
MRKQNVTNAWLTEALKKEERLFNASLERNKNRAGAAVSVVLDPIGVPTLQPSRTRREPSLEKADEASPTFQPPEIEEVASVVGSAARYPKSAAGSKSNQGDEIIHARLAALETLLEEERRRSRAAEDELKSLLSMNQARK